MSTHDRRDTYRHGHLADALVSAGLELARRGGPEAVVLREATRQAGVVPNAAYRHFADRAALLRAIRAVALIRLGEAMEAEQALVPTGGDPRQRAVLRLRATGRGYLHFARAEPGLFRAAFVVDDADDLDTDAASQPVERLGAPPLRLVSQALDDLVTTGALSPDRRVDADLIAWSTVHGLAMLIESGPLRGLDGPHIARLEEQLLDVVVAGL